MVQVPLVFFFLALVILLGFAAQRVFQQTRFPDVPLLLCLGLLLGPLNRAAVAQKASPGSDFPLGSVFLDNSLNLDSLRTYAPFVSQLALVVILFDSGLKLDFTQFRKSMKPAFLHTFPLFLLTVGIIAVIAHAFMGMPPLVAAILGVALSNVGQTVSAAIIREVNFDQSTRSIYFIEMALYDLLSIPILTGLLQIPLAGAASANPQVFVQGLSRVIIVSLFIGVLGGFLWVQVLRRLEDYPYSYMVTLASLLLVYSLNSFLGGSGPVSVLVFGLVIGNRATLLKMVRKGGPDVLHGQRVQSFHDEITFFVRAFFFIYLGVSFQTMRPGEWNVTTRVPGLQAFDNTATLFLLATLLVFGAILAARWTVVNLVSSRGHPERRKLFAVYGRGLGTAVLATYPFTLTAFTAPASANDQFYRGLFLPWESVFVNVALLIILLTVAGTGVTVFLQERRSQAAASAEKTKGRSAAKE